MIAPNRARAAALSVLVLASSGCFRYVPTEIAPVPPGENVRLVLTQEGMAELRALSADAAATVAGTVMSWGSDGLMLRIPTRRDPGGVYGETIGQDVRIPTQGIAQLERRRLDTVRTGLVTALSVVGIGAAIVAIVSDGFGNDELGPSPPDNQARVPLLSLPAP